MLEFSTNMFHYFKEDKTFSQEASSLELHPREWNSLRRIPVKKTVKLTNPKTQNSEVFSFTMADMSPENEVYGWNYKSESGLNLLIIND
jgi:hypothetical protein